MRRYFIILFASILAVACSKDSVAYLDVATINQGFEFGFEGGKSLGTILTNTDFEIVSDSPWCKVVRYSDNKVSNFRVDVEENLYAVKRVATLTVTAEGCTDRYIKARQDAAAPILSVGAGQTSFTLTQNAAELLLDITSNVNVEVTLPDWITLGEGVEIEMGRNTYKFYVDAMSENYRAGTIVLESTDNPGMKTVVNIKQVSSDMVYFQDDFSWTEGRGPALCHSTTGEKRWDDESLSNVQRPAWTTSIFTGAGSAEAPTPAAWTRDGYIRLNYAKKPGNLITPKLDKIEGTVNLEVSFRACRYQNSGGADGYHEIHVSCLGAGDVDTEKIIIDNCNNLSASDAPWNTLDNSLYTFKVTGATAQTQIEFHFGPRREAADYNTNLSVTPAGEANSNTRMGFDDVKVTIDLN